MAAHTCNTMQAYWRRLDGRRIPEPFDCEIGKVLQAEIAAGHTLRVCIGTDSQVKGSLIDFATVVVFIRQGKGGFMFIRSDSSKLRMSIRQRMLTEVSKSIEVAYALSPLLMRYGVPLEIHADINTHPKFKSNTALQDAMGFILGMGFAFKAKPHAFASSSCANKVVQ